MWTDGKKDFCSFGKLPNIWTCNLFLWITQTLQELTTALTKLFILGTQYLDRVRRITNWLPPCNKTRCVNFTRSRESAHSYGRIIGCRSSYRKLSEAVTRPHALTSPFLSRKGFRERIELAPGRGRFWLKQRYSSEKYLRWVQIAMSCSAEATSWGSRRTPESGDCLRHRWTNRWTYARTRKALS